MSLSHRLRLVQMSQMTAPVAVEDLSHLSREELASEVITFGQKHQGETYQQAWEDQEWVAFMVSRYSSSTKNSHRRFLKYVELQVEYLEQTQVPVMPSRGTPAVNTLPKSKAKAKAGPKTRAQPASVPEVQIFEPTDLEVEEEWDPTVPYMTDPETMHAMQSRMLNMEDALLRVMRHLEEQSVNSNMAHSQTQHE